ncbi:MAG: L-seryl-tRNA(Sec) selenium transferase [Chloroflexi bacterium]|nr:L-seryl-tRNA(Sec) selenium transferase [Chloroflexota bacterium]
MENELRRLPSVDRVLSDPQIKPLEASYPHQLLVDFTRRELERQRQAIVSGKPVASLEQIVAAVRNDVESLDRPSLRPVINATGVILHTNLGRAPLSEETIAAMATASRGYSNLEFDLETGARGSRHVHIEKLLCQLTGAEAGLVVNNNAAAVLLGLIVVARRKEVIVSRGQAVEIGGGFRIPDVMRQSGAKLVEVGTTNCTYIRDFDQAISPRTAALLRVHSSNFKVVGFTAEVTIDELAELSKRHNVLVLDDLGSGCFLDTTRFGLAPEPMVQHSVAVGVDLTFFSGDKLVGGPQAGIIVGKKALIDKLKKHPLARAMRIDKTRLAGLAATLRHYLKGEAEKKVPVWRLISMPLADVEHRANLWAEALGPMARVIPGETMVGGGSLPGGTLPTRLVALGGEGKKGLGLAQSLAKKLRSSDTPIIGRISENQLLLDPHSVLPEEDGVVVEGLKKLKSEATGKW